MEAIQMTLDHCSIQANPSDILSLTGGDDPATVDYSDQLLEELIARSRLAIDPRGAWIRLKGNGPPEGDEVLLQDIRFQTGRIVTRMLKGSSEYALFAVTIGAGPENLARKLMEEGNYLEGYLVDLIGSALVESATEQVHEQIRESASKEGLRVTNRYSPGYCGWEVSEQQKLFSLLPDNLCGIQLSDSSLMSPIKSVSGLVGMGPSVAFRDYTCELCSMTHCAFRRVRE